MNDPRLVISYIHHQIQAGNCNIGEDRIKLDCPVCDDTKKHFYLYLSSFTAHCFRCEAHFNLRGILTFTDLRAFKQNGVQDVAISRKPDVRFDDWDATPICPISNHDPGVNSVACQAYWRCIERGVTSQQIEQYVMSVRPWIPRIYFPVWDDNGTLTYWCSRTLLDEEPRMDSLKDSVRPLYGRHVRRFVDQVILVEGVFDHLVTRQSYAILGASITKSQTAILVQDGIRRVFVIGDVDARTKADRSVHTLVSQGIQAYSIHLSVRGQIPYKDPSDCGRGIMSEVATRLLGMTPTRPQVLHMEVLPATTTTGDGLPVPSV